MRTAVARELDHSIASATVELLLPLVSYLCSCPVRDHDMDKLSLSACSRIHQHTSCLLIIRCARSVTQADGTNTSTHVNRVWHLASGDIMILLHAWSMALILFQVQKNAVCNSKMHSRGTAKSRGIAFENKNKKNDQTHRHASHSAHHPVNSLGLHKIRSINIDPCWLKDLKITFTSSKNPHLTSWFRN